MNDSNTLAPLSFAFHQAGWVVSSAIGACAILILSASQLAASPSTGGEFSVVGSAVGGGGSAAGGSFSLEGTAGRPSTGVSSGGDSSERCKLRLNARERVGRGKDEIEQRPHEALLEDHGPTCARPQLRGAPGPSHRMGLQLRNRD